MGGLSFVHAGFVVAGVAAAALPVLIHLLMKQRARPLPIGSVRFLRSVLREHTRRKRIRQWLLLALRTLIVLLLALLFARPFLSRWQAGGLDRQVILLLDRSASMQAQSPSGGSHFDAAVREAGRELDRLDDKTAIHVGAFDSGGVVGVPVDELRRVEPSDAATDYGAALAWARDLAVSSPRPRQEIVLITDLQRSGLDGMGLDGMGLDGTVMDGLPPDTQLRIHDVGSVMSQNVSLEDVTPVSTEIRPKEPVRIAVRVTNSGAVPARDVPVQLSLRGPPGLIRQQQTVTLLGGAAKTLEFFLDDLAVDGMYEGTVSLQWKDDLQADNRRFLAFEARHPDRLLLVDGQQGRSVYTNETYYLETALRLRMPPGGGPQRSFEIERIVWEDGDGFPSLEGFRAVVLCNVARLTSGDAERLREYVSAGGNLLVFAGDQTTPAVMERLRTAELLSVQVATEPVKGLFRCRAWNRQHPVFRPFDDPQRGDLRRVGFERLMEVTEVGEAAQTLIHAGPYPLVVEQPLGEGTTLLVTTSADRDWSDWPRSRMYVPLVRQMMAYLTRQLEGRQPVRWETIEQAGEKAGITQDGPVRVVKNMAPRESQLQRVSEGEFRELLGLEDVPPEQLAAGLNLPSGVRRPNEFWEGLMWALLMVLVVETLFASRVMG